MDPIITNTLLGTIIAAVGWMGRTLWESVKAYKTGHAEALQQRDEIIADNESQIVALKRRKTYLHNEYNYMRAWILSQPLTEDQLKRMPKPPPRDH